MTGGDTQEKPKPKVKVVMQETFSRESLLEETLWKQGEMLQQQQKNIEAILARMDSSKVRQSNSNRLQCGQSQ